MIILNVEDLKNFKIHKEKELAFSFRLNNNFNRNSGEKIIAFLKKLDNQEINFKITRSLPRCIFNISMLTFLKKVGVTFSCLDCKELYTLTSEGFVKSCEVINKIGPKMEYIKDKNQIRDYFSTFHNEMELLDNCRNCLLFKRKKCNALCFKK